jgi:hypothetical protein
MLTTSTASTNKEKTQTDLLLVIWEDIERTANATARSPSPKTIANFIPRQFPIDESNDVVLATHASCSKLKLEVLRAQMSNWGGAVSAALYISSEQDIRSLGEFIASVNTYHITIHVMLEMPQKEGYPHNQLRNLALENIGSDYFVALDADFIPPKDSYSNLVSLVLSNKHFRNQVRNRRLFVLPAFEIFPKKGERFATPDMIPASKNQLKDMVKKKLANGFKMDVFPIGHEPTNFARWLQEDTNLKNQFYNIEYSVNFEPYVLGYRPGIPRYWPHFRGFGHNKTSWFLELHRAGYSFGVLTDFYVVHLNHPNNLDLKQDQINFRKTFRHKSYLKKRYPAKVR